MHELQMTLISDNQIVSWVSFQVDVLRVDCTLTCYHSQLDMPDLQLQMALSDIASSFPYKLTFAWETFGMLITGENVSIKMRV